MRMRNYQSEVSCGNRAFILSDKALVDKMLTPIVLWAQRNQFILLRVQMRLEEVRYCWNGRTVCVWAYLHVWYI